MTTTIEKRGLVAHLARRAGFGANPEELDSFANDEYSALVDLFLEESESGHLPDDLIFRRFPNIHDQQTHNAMYWALRMLTTDRQIEDKIALFWHGIFATGEGKINNFGAAINQIDTFRRHGLGSFDNLLLELSKDPAMLIWLDNQTNHKDQINENYGRELLELFSMGVGNYSEQDIRECSRAFTGWTVKNSEYMAMMGNKDSIWPYGRIFWHFEYREDDHDDGHKTFLGEEGDWNGDDIIRIICQQEATAKFISRHLYNFFVADETPVPQWNETTPRDSEAIDCLVKTYFDSDHSIKAMLKVLFNSDFFKEAKFRRVKSPAELIIGTLRATGDYMNLSGEDTSVYHVMEESGFMGQKLNNPPTVEGWHTGEEWITSGSIVDRVNFAARHYGNEKSTGVIKLILRIRSKLEEEYTSAQLIETCLSSMGELKISVATYQTLLTIADEAIENPDSKGNLSDKSVSEIFRMIVSSREFQMC